MDIKNKHIIAITGCAAGIAHTYMAAEGIETAAKELGALAKVETHGTGGHDNILTAKDIRDADIVIIAADISVDKMRFVGKLLYSTNTTLAIANPQKLLEEAFEGATKYKARNMQNGSGGSNVIDTGTIQKEGKVLPHIMFALSWMVPLIIAGGLVMAIGNVFAMQPGWLVTGSIGWGGVLVGDVYPDFGVEDAWINNGIYIFESVYNAFPDIQEWITVEGTNDMWYFIKDLDKYVTIVRDGQIYNFNEYEAMFGVGSLMEYAKVWSFEGRAFFNTLFSGGAVAMKLIYPVIAAAIAYSIAGKLTFAPAFIGGWIMNDGDFLHIYVNGSPVGTGFIGAILIGFFVGYMGTMFRKINVNRTFKGLCDLMLWPFLMVLIVVIMSRYVFSYPLGWFTIAMFQTIIWIGALPGGNLLLAALVAGMICTDLGGPINKTALVAGTAIFLASQALSMNPNEWNFVPGTATQAAISIPPLIAFFSVTLFPKFFSNQEKTLGTNASFMGLVGITEGAIPFAVSKPKIFVPANIIGGMVSAMLITSFGFQFYGGLGSPLAPILGYVPSTVVDSYLLSTLVWISCYITGALVGVSLVYAGFVLSLKKQKAKKIIKIAKAEAKTDIKKMKHNIKKAQVAKQNEIIAKEKAKIVNRKTKLKNEILKIKETTKEEISKETHSKNDLLKIENKRWNSEMEELKNEIQLKKQGSEVEKQKEIYKASLEKIKLKYKEDKLTIKNDSELTKDDITFKIKILKESKKDIILNEQSKNNLMNSQNTYKKEKKNHTKIIGNINADYIAKIS